MSATRRQFLSGSLGAAFLAYTKRKRQPGGARVRIADVRACPVQSTWLWDGAEWATP